MIEKIKALLINIKNAAYSLEDIWDVFADRVNVAFHSSDMIGIWESLLGILKPFFTFLPFVFLALAAVELLFGKKLLGIQKFLFFAFAGFVGGVVFVAPLLSGVLPLPSYISGAVIAILAAVISRYLYLFSLAGLVAYGTYYVCYAGKISFIASMTQGNLLIGVAAGVVAMIIVFIFRKFFERVGTSFLGAFLITYIIKKAGTGGLGFDYVAKFGWGNILNIVILVVLTLVGFIVQHKTRARY